MPLIEVGGKSSRTGVRKTIRHCRQPVLSYCPAVAGQLHLDSRAVLLALHASFPLYENVSDFSGFTQFDFILPAVCSLTAVYQ